MSAGYSKEITDEMITPKVETVSESIEVATVPEIALIPDIERRRIEIEP